MSYYTISKCTADQEFVSRVQACIVQEQNSHNMNPSPLPYLESFKWVVATAADVESAYASALAAYNPHPGGDPAVITDGMILANVQAHWDDIVNPPRLDNSLPSGA